MKMKLKHHKRQNQKENHKILLRWLLLGFVLLLVLSQLLFQRLNPPFVTLDNDLQLTNVTFDFFKVKILQE